MPSTTSSSDQNSTAVDRHQSFPSGKTADSPDTLFEFPPESYWVSKGDEKDWFNRNAIIERKSSRKLSFSGSKDHQSKPISNRSVLPSNHKPKASLIALPMAQKSPLPTGNPRQIKAGNRYLFRSRSEPGGKSRMQTTEPASPQVSCLGKVGTKKEKSKRTGLWRSIAAAIRTGFKANMAAGKLIRENIESDEQENRAPDLAGLKRFESGRRS